MYKFSAKNFKNVGLLINSSRSIIYASNDHDFDLISANKAQEIQSQMQDILDLKGFI